MSEVLKSPAQVAAAPKLDANWRSIRLYLPFLLPTLGAFALTLLRIQMGGENFIDDGALMMLALAGYLIGAAFLLTNLYAPSGMAQKIGLWAAGAGFFFNLASWCIRWVAAHDRELAILQRNGYGPDQMPWVWRYIPFANLYDLSLAFACGAGLTTMLISGRRSFRFIGALSLPLAALILILARFIGGEFINLPPVLDSYWRPIHVGIAALSYGIALVCFAVAVVYLLKDGVKTEAMAVWASIFALLVFGTISRGTVFGLGSAFWDFDLGTFGLYRASVFLPPRFALPLRADIPYAGWAIFVAGLLLLGVVTAFCLYLFKQSEQARRLGH